MAKQVTQNAIFSHAWQALKQQQGSVDHIIDEDQTPTLSANRVSLYRNFITRWITKKFPS